LAAGIYGLALGLAKGNNLHRVLFEFRWLLFYLLVPVFAYAWTAPSLRKSIVSGVFWTGALASTVTLAMQLGMLPESIAAWFPHKSTWFAGRERLVSYNQSFILFTFLAAVGVWEMDRRRSWPTLVGLLAGVSLLLTLSRNMWIGTLLGLLVVGVTAKRSLNLRPMIGRIFVRLSLVAGAFLVLGLGGAELFQRRLRQLFGEDLFSDSSVIWRLLEVEFATKAIRRHPLVGNGLGFRYHDQGAEVGLPYYVHNEYLFAWMKLGVPGLLAMVFALGMGAVLLRKALRASAGSGASRLSRLEMGLMLGGMGWLVASSVAALVRPVFLETHSGGVLYSLLVAIALYRSSGNRRVGIERGRRDVREGSPG
jgi:O-antigen ligase